jgi:membrane protein
MPAGGWRGLYQLGKGAVNAWIGDRAGSMGAALAFYSAFSMAPLLIIVIAVAGLAFGADQARVAIMGELHGLLGPDGAAGVETLLAAASRKDTSLLATLVGILTLLIGATTVLVELQDDLDHIWKAPPRRGNGLLNVLRSRLMSLGMILGVGFLLLVSLVVSGAIATFEKWSGGFFPDFTVVLLIINTLLSLIVITILFAMLYKWLPNTPIAWRDVWLGAFATAVLFEIGRVLIGLYLGRSAVASAYGAAGTVVVLFLWLYYSAQIFLFGAEFTAQVAGARGRAKGYNRRASDRLHTRS